MDSDACDAEQADGFRLGQGAVVAVRERVFAFHQ